jgi:hypothetical protein
MRLAHPRAAGAKQVRSGRGVRRKVITNRVFAQTIFLETRMGKTSY